MVIVLVCVLASLGHSSAGPEHVDVDITALRGRCRGWCACMPATWRTSRKPPLATLWPCSA